MAAGEREDQPAEATGAEVVGGAGKAGSGPSGLQSPRARRFGKQVQGLGKEEQAERLAQLRKDNLESRQQREAELQRRRAREADMAADYKERLEERLAKSREERQHRLAHLHQRAEERKQQKIQEIIELAGEDGNEEYRELVEKYGHLVRVPPVPPEFSRSARESASPRKPRVPVAGKNALGSTSLAGKNIVRGHAGSAAPAASDKAAKGGKSAAAMRGSMVSGTRASSSAPMPAISTPTHALRHGADPDADAARAASPDANEIPEPERSLMPRKDGLRKFQQNLLKKTEVVFYKKHMRKHFRKILETTELTFNDNIARRQQASWNLAKPLSIAEIKQLSSVAVVQP